MRVTSGFAKSMLIKVPESKSTRPTSEKVRSAILNSVQPIICKETRVLDLYAGTGAMGLESLSRGAGSVVAVENDRECLKVLEANFSELERRSVAQNLPVPRWTVLGLEVSAACERMVREKQNFELIFADPPYSHFLESGENILRWSSELLVSGGVLCLELGARDLDLIRKRPYTELGLVKTRDKTYGKTGVVLFEKINPSSVRK